MKRIHSLTATVAVLMAFAGIALAQSTKPTASLSAQEDRAIRNILAALDVAWNTHEMKTLEGLFHEDAEFINVVGMHWRGRSAIVAAHVAYHKTIFKAAGMKTDAIALRPLGADFAIAVVTQTQDTFTTPSGEVVSKHQNKLSYVFTKVAGEWKIAHGQNVRIDAEAAPHDPVNSVQR